MRSHRATQSAGAPPDVDTTDDDGTRGVHPHREHAPRRARRRAILRRIEPLTRQQRRPSSPELTIGVRHLPGGRARRRGPQTRRRASLRGAPARRARVAPHLPSQRAHRAPRTRIALLRRRALRRRGRPAHRARARGGDRASPLLPARRRSRIVRPARLAGRPRGDGLERTTRGRRHAG